VKPRILWPLAAGSAKVGGRAQDFGVFCRELMMH
jgi:hypothetical protein